MAECGLVVLAPIDGDLGGIAGEPADRHGIGSGVLQIGLHHGGWCGLGVLRDGWHRQPSHHHGDGGKPQMDQSIGEGHWHRDDGGELADWVTSLLVRQVDFTGSGRLAASGAQSPGIGAHSQ